MDSSCTLQVNLHPSDVPHVEQVLPHQLRVLGGQVDEVVLSLNLRETATSRYSTSDHGAKRSRLLRVVDAVARDPKVRVHEVDWGAARREELSSAFLGGRPVPETAADGGPFLAYLDGLHQVRTRHVLHLDSDMLLGGGSPSWTREAVRALSEHPDVMACCPFPGPPRADGRLLRGRGARAVEAPWPAFRFPTFTGRVFLVDLDRFRSGELVVPLVRPELRRRIDGLINAAPPVVPLEECMSRLQQQRGSERLDLLGSGPGLWTLHPLWRSEAFTLALPRIVAAVESGDVPDGQRGDFDVNDSMVDWSSVRAGNTRVARVRRRTKWAAAGVGRRLHRRS